MNIPIYDAYDIVRAESAADISRRMTVPKVKQED